MREVLPGRGPVFQAAAHLCPMKRPDRWWSPVVVPSVGILLAVTAFALFARTGGHTFLTFDDPVYVTANPMVSGGFSARTIARAFISLDAGNWHPVTWLSHMLDVELFGMAPRGHHLVSVAIHACSTLLLFLLLNRLTGALWRSSSVALFFAVHPLHVETVAWVAERKDVLGGLFWILTLLMYSGYTSSRTAGRYLLCLGTFITGLMAKPMLVTLPLVMLLLDYWPLGRYRKTEENRDTHDHLPLIREKIPFVICSLASAVITLYAQGTWGAISGLAQTPLPLRIQNALVSYAVYLGKTLWPDRLAVYYPFPLYIPLWHTVAAVALLAVISIAVLRWRQQQPWLPVGWFWFLITLVPVIGLVQVGGQAMADRYTYLPSIGLFVMAAWGVPELLAGIPFRRSALAALTAGAAVFFFTVAWRQTGLWRDSITLYRHTLEVTGRNSLISYNLALELHRRGDLKGAVHHYREALAVNPFHTDTHNNLGLALQAQGDSEGAMAAFQAAIRVNRSDPKGHINLGGLLHTLGRMNAAMAAYGTALEIDPGNGDARYNRGVILQENGDLQGAIREYRSALQHSMSHRNTPAVHNNLALALAAEGDFTGAVAHYREALRLLPENAVLKENLRIVLERTPAGQLSPH